jgi:hypothetical protein
MKLLLDENLPYDFTTTLRICCHSYRLCSLD